MKAKMYDYIKPEVPEIYTDTKNYTDIVSDMIVPVFKNDIEDGVLKSDDLVELDRKLNGVITRNINTNKFNGEEESKLIIAYQDKCLIIFGCGNDPSFDDSEYIEEEKPGMEKVRMLGTMSAELSATTGLDKVAIAFRGFSNAPNEEIMYRVLAEGIVRGCYNFNYKKEDKDKKSLPKEVCILIPNRNRAVSKKGIPEGVMLGKNINFAKALIDEPSNTLYPKSYVKVIKEYLKDSPCEIDVWDMEKIKKKGMGCLYAVGQGSIGSEHESKFVIVRSTKKSKNGKIALVGKGITYDTGGYNLKRKPLSILKMKKDMGGSACVLAAFKQLLDKDIDMEIVLALPLAHNLVSRSAIKPGDIVKAYDGRTVEIINTDAEGRLVVADAVSYIIDKEKPDYLLDATTLTGATFLTLGLKIGGVMGNNPKLTRMFLESAREEGEEFWELPLSMKYREEIVGSISDLMNKNKSNSPFAGALIAGLFIKEFADKCKNWIHLDMSAPIYSLNKNYLGEGALGYSIASIVRFVEKLSTK